MSDLVGNPEDQFSHVAAHSVYSLCLNAKKDYKIDNVDKDTVGTHVSLTDILAHLNRRLMGSL